MKVYNLSVAGAEARGKWGQLEGARGNHVKVLALRGQGGGPGKPLVSGVGGDMVRLAVSCGCPRYEDWAETGPEVGIRIRTEATMSVKRDESHSEDR